MPILDLSDSLVLLISVLVCICNPGAKFIGVGSSQDSDN